MPACIRCMDTMDQGSSTTVRGVDLDAVVTYMALFVIKRDLVYS
jgi:hypothetical protein